MIETFTSILRAEDLLPDSAMTIKFVGYVTDKHVVGMIASILIGQLLDSLGMQIFNKVITLSIMSALREWVSAGCGAVCESSLI